VFTFSSSTSPSTKDHLPIRYSQLQDAITTSDKRAIMWRNKAINYLSVHSHVNHDEVKGGEITLKGLMFITDERDLKMASWS